MAHYLPLSERKESSSRPSLRCSSRLIFVIPALIFAATLLLLIPHLPYPSVTFSLLDTSSSQSEKSKSTLQPIHLTSPNNSLHHSSNSSATPSQILKLLHNSCDTNPEPPIFPLFPAPSSLPKVLRQYASWHATQRACLASNTCKNVPNILVWRCPKHYQCAGLGNRLDGMIFSLLFSIATNRLFFIHWSPLPFRLSSVLAPAIIDWRLPQSIPHNASWPELQWHTCEGHYNRPCLDGSIFMPNISHLPHFDFKHSENDVDLTSTDVENLLHNVSVLAMSMRLATLWPFGVNPHFGARFSDLVDTDEKEESMRRHLMHMLFTPSPLLRDNMDRVGLNSSYIGVHVRTGIDVGESYTSRFEDIVSRLNETASEILKCLNIRYGNEAKQVFLATDSVKFKDIFRDEAKKLNITVGTTTEKSMHITHFDGKSMAKQMWKCDALKVVYVDLTVLAGSTDIIMTGSSFARTAMLLGDASRLDTWDMKKSAEEQCRPLKSNAVP